MTINLLETNQKDAVKYKMEKWCRTESIVNERLRFL